MSKQGDVVVDWPARSSVFRQIEAANNRIRRANRVQLDNEYAEGVRDALSWVLGMCQMPFVGDGE